MGSFPRSVRPLLVGLLLLAPLAGTLHTPLGSSLAGRALPDLERATTAGPELGTAPRAGGEASAALFEVNFSQTGLPVGFTWYVNLSGRAPQSSQSDLLTVKLPNGTYTFTSGLVAGHWLPEPGSGTVVVLGATVGPAIAFTYTCAVTIDRPAGTDAGVLWGVTLSGSQVLPTWRPSVESTTATTDEPTVLLYEPNGTYGFLVTDTARASYQDSGTTVVAGAPVTIVPVSLNRPPNDTALIAAVVSVVAAVAIAGVVVTLWRPRGGSPRPARDRSGRPPSG